jgi:hypothetical protein
MIGRLPDLLASVPWRQRAEREREDALYIARSRTVLTASKASLKRDFAVWAGTAGFMAKDLRPLRRGQKFDFVVCARVDLDHPIYFRDNRFCPCVDCGCDLQYRPAAPPGEHICVCCAARRIREE